MRMGRFAHWMLAAAPVALCFLTGCGDFWEAPSTSTTTGFSLSASQSSVTVAPGATSGSVSLTVTPGSSFTGTVTLSCSVTSFPTGATSSEYPTCNFTSSSLDFTTSTAQSSTFTAVAPSTSPTGAYEMNLTGVSGSTAETTSFCVEVSNTSTATCATTPTSSGDFYILNGGTAPQFQEFNISSNSLTKVGSAVSLTGVIPNALAIAPSGGFLEVGTSTGVYAYQITNGVAASTGVNVNSDNAYAVQIDSTDSWLIDVTPSTTSSDTFILNAYPIDSSTGAPASGTVGSASFAITGASLPYGQMVISGDNKHVFVALESGGTAIVPFNSSAPFPSGVQATTIPVATSGGSALSVAVDPGASPRVFYIGEVSGVASGTGGLLTYAYGSPWTTKVGAGSPIDSGGLAPSYILPTANGDYVYVADSAGTISGFSITGSASAGYTVATAGTSVTAGDQLAGMAEDSSGGWVFEVGSSGSPYFDAYTIGSGGQLTSEATSTSAATSVAIVAVP